MEHANFLNDAQRNHFDWRVTNWSSAVRIALGRKALWSFRIAFVVLLAPTLVLAAYSLYSHRPPLLILVLLSFWGFWTASTSPTGIGLIASMFTAIIGVVFSVLMQDPLLACSSVLPGVTWFGSCAILGTTAQLIIAAVCSSEALFRMLVDCGILKFMATAESSDAQATSADAEF